MSRREKIEGVTIAHNGTVNWEGHKLVGDEWVHFTHSTNTHWHRFDWSRIPSHTRVIVLEGSDISKVWSELISRAFPSFDAKREAAKNAGLRCTEVQQIRKEVAGVG